MLHHAIPISAHRYRLAGWNGQVFTNVIQETSQRSRYYKINYRLTVVDFCR